MSAPLRLVVLISGNGSNLQAIIDAINAEKINATICVVISNKADAYGLQRAEQQQIANEIIDSTAFANREAFDLQLQKKIEQYQADYIVLAGFMRILSAGFVTHFQSRILNIHPSLLPKYRGLDTHARALAAKDKEHGCSIHFVTAELDGGPVIAQAKLQIECDDTEQSLQQRVHSLEHQLYPLVISWLADKRLCEREGQLYLNDQPLAERGHLCQF